jgi:hypothetical protein
MSKRTETMRSFARIAKDRDSANDATLRNQASQTWREMATEAEAKRAPKYLTWIGRR